MTCITTNVKHRARTTGSEHQGQNSISDPDQNLGFTCIFSSGMQEHIFFMFFEISQGDEINQKGKHTPGWCSFLSLSHTFTDFAPVELRFIPNLLVSKVGVNRDGKEEKSSINTVSHDAPTVSARFVYGSTTTHAGSATIHPD